MKIIDISIIVCTYNRADTLRSALESVIRQETDGNFSYEIVVIDDGSIDNTRDVVKEILKCSKVPIGYIYKKGEGIADARNRGIRYARGKWIAFIDDDQLAENDWLKNLYVMALRMHADCVGGTILLDLQSDQLSRLGPVIRKLLGERSWPKRPSKCLGKKIPSNGNILIAKKVFDSIGLFDTVLLSGGEDAEFILRARAANFDIWIAPKAIMRHLVPPYRLQPTYLRLVSFRWGTFFAYMDHKRRNHCRMLLVCIARIGQALLVNMPCLLLVYLKCNIVEILDRKCLLWRAQGYTRRCLFFISPKLFPQKRFFSALEYRINGK